ncbi:hypothetical protein [Pelagibius sp. 7325]|uniref:hypothetical protein n=1 Tax=Pelagibius sp. 7325 TaxID=3131994 RepID=UPI0030EC3476
MPKRSTAAADHAAPPPKAAAKRTGTARNASKATPPLSPLDYMLQVLRDPEASPAERKWAAEKAAPFIHPRLQTVEHGGALTLSHEDALEALK